MVIPLLANQDWTPMLPYLCFFSEEDPELAFGGIGFFLLSFSFKKFLNIIICYKILSGAK